MLPAEQRVRRPSDYSGTVRDGRRVGGVGLVLHVRATDSVGPARVGFVVGRGVGTAVVRNRVRRQLRHLISPRLAELPDGTDVVIRVLPAAAALSRQELAATVAHLVDRAVRGGAAG